MPKPTPAVSPGTVDYKTLFMGCSLLVSILGGGLYSLWVSKSDSDIESNHTTNLAQWERLRFLNDALIELKSKHDTLRTNVDDQEVRLRSLERSKR